MAEANRWNQVYAQEDHLFTKQPNAFLMELAASMTPGRALDIGMGQGRNAIALATLGWDVTGLDIAEEGLRQAEAAGPRVQVVRQSAEDFAIGEGQWDLIAGIYVHGVMLRESSRIIAGCAWAGVWWWKGSIAM